MTGHGGILAVMAERTAFITGGTGAIGQGVVRELVARGFTVLVACRDAQRGAALLEGLGRPVAARVVELELASLGAIAETARRVNAELAGLSLLVHCAGVWSRQRKTSADGFELTFAVNHLAPFALTAALAPALERAAGRVVTVASGLHVRGKLAWDDVMQTRGGFNGVRAYEQSKLANVMFALGLARRRGKAFSSVALHPGIVRSGLTREYPELWKEKPANEISAAAAARSVAEVAAAPGLARTSGVYYDGTRVRPASALACERAAQDRLWQLSEELVARVR